LTGYSGWNIGVSIAQAFARWALLHTAREMMRDRLLQSAQSHLELLLEALAHEEGYRNHVRGGAVAYARSLGDDPQRLQTRYEEINAYAITHTEALGDRWYQTHFAGKEIVLGIEGAKTVYGMVDRLNGWRLLLPWNRTAEMEVFPELTIVVSSKSE
jgi:hypothetical protein